jgi:hypothetical protein
MPNLPSINIDNQDHYDRIVAAFPGETQADKAAFYRRWSKNNLIDFVIQRELAGIEDEVVALRTQRVQEIQSTLPSRDEA